MLLLLVIGAVSASPMLSGFYVENTESLPAEAVTCLELHNQEAILSEILYKGQVMHNRIDFLQACSDTMEIYGIVTFGRQTMTQQKVLKQYQLLLSELEKRNVTPILFIRLESIRTGYTTNEKALEFLNEIKRMADTVGVLGIGLSTTETDYMRILGNVSIANEDINILFNSADGNFTSIGGIKSPNVVLTTKSNLVCKSLSLNGLNFVSNIRGNKPRTTIIGQPKPANQIIQKKSEKFKL